MKIESIKYVGVNEEGLVASGGAIKTGGSVMMGYGEGCGLGDCHCSDGYWISIVKPRTKDGVVEGIRVVFNDVEEMDFFLNCHEINMDEMKPKEKEESKEGGFCK